MDNLRVDKCGQLEVSKGVFSSTYHFLKTRIYTFFVQRERKGRMEGRREGGRKEGNDS